MHLKLSLCCLALFIFQFGSAQSDYLYGTTRYGGENGGGTFYRIKSDGSERKVLHNFRLIPSIYPNSKFVDGADGLIYGTSRSGGRYDYGTLYGYDLANDKYELLHEFKNDSIGREPIDFLFLYQDSLLIGSTANGSRLFRYDINSKRIDLLEALSRMNLGYKIQSAFNYKDKVLVGAYNSIGSAMLFEYDFQTDSAQIFIDIDSLAINPAVQVDDSTYIGTAFRAPDSPFSYIYKIDSKKDSISIIKRLSLNQEGGRINENLIKYNDSLLYGSCLFGGPYPGGSIFEYNLSNSQFRLINTNLWWVGNSMRNLVQIGSNKLMGSYFSGGATIYGMIFIYDILQDTVLQKIQLKSEETGGYPGSFIHPLNTDTFLIVGRQPGTLLSYSVSADSFKVELKYGGSKDGAYPHTNLVQMNSHIIGGSSLGSKFFKWKYGLSQSNMEFSKQSSRIEAPFLRYDSLSFYFTPEIISTSAYLWKYDQHALFKGSTFLRDTRNAIGWLLKHSNCNIYGVGNNGGTLNQGCIYQYDPSSDQYRIIYNFGNAPNIGNNPIGSLVEDQQGKLIGIARKTNSSTLFKLDVINETIDSIAQFPFTPYSNTGFDVYNDSLLLGMYEESRVLYFFSFDLDNSTYHIIDSLSVGAEFRSSYTRPIISDSGHAYYSIFDSGNNGQGAIYKYDIRLDSFYIFLDFADSTGIYGSNPNELLIFNPFLTSINKNAVEQGQGLMVYPNPFEDRLIVQSEEVVKQIEIYDLKGKLVFRREKVRSRNFELNPQLDNGVYIIRFIQDGGTHSLKLIKQ